MTLNHLLQLAKKRKVKLQRSFEKHQFDWRFNSTSLQQHDLILAQVESALRNKLIHEDIENCFNSNDPLVQQGTRLRIDLEALFKNCMTGLSDERIMIQIPEARFSPAGFSLFSNLMESLNYIGIPARALGWEEDTQIALDQFKPTVLLSSDHDEYLRRIDWGAITRYKASKHLRVGLSAALEEYESSPLLPRLAWAKKYQIDFYYSYRDKDYVKSRKEYQPFFDAGFNIIFIPFGANILHYFPVAEFERDLNYVLMASRKREHITYLKNITSEYSGFLDGPGWKQVKNFQFNRERDRYIYARAKVGLNVHLPEQIDWACELNERTYQLAACGVPQLIDHPMLLDKMFGSKSFFIAESPAQYFELFKELMHDPQLGVEKALYAQKEVFASHTTFHRAKSLIDQLKLLT
ncbi:glycosyltransferase [Polynucleobacter arcticus]|uniref:Spore protein YkvP/CgeB glycosyl transferase-like domain-containing protein n=1 Tax=Polynucleobacter arcticus TaxID=1743165 RepID=A0A6M9PH99_9BURK|nr:glycosyltransferase [Polynucleobacter arcticus]QKM59779.1 hypothetical protein DN92_01280 [Polynucleobacter arcticus]